MEKETVFVFHYTVTERGFAISGLVVFVVFCFA